jgi:hypothetical protein
MCIICVELDNNKLSPWEAKRNFAEMRAELEQEHQREVENKISDLIFEEVNMNYGDTIQQTLDFCDFCDCFPCSCHWEGIEL